MVTKLVEVEPTSCSVKYTPDETSCKQAIANLSFSPISTVIIKEPSSKINQLHYKLDQFAPTPHQPQYQRNRQISNTRSTFYADLFLCSASLTRSASRKCNISLTHFVGRVLGSSSLLRVDVATELLDFVFILFLTFPSRTPLSEPQRHARHCSFKAISLQATYKASPCLLGLW